MAVYFAQTKIKGGKMLKVSVEVEEESGAGGGCERRITKVRFYGDFFLHPEDTIEEIEKALIGECVDKDRMVKKIEAVLREANAEAIGVSPMDFADIIVVALRSEPGKE